MPRDPLAAESFLIDLDGTLVDSSPLHAAAYVAALGDAHPELLQTFSYDALRGLSTEASLRLLGVREPTEVARLAGAKRARFQELADAGVPLFDGAIGLLQTLHRLDRRSFLVTSGGRASVEATLRSTGLLTELDGVVTADDVTETKPSPAPFLTCCSRFAIEPAAATVVEDALAGVAGARAAGIGVVGVHDPSIAPLVDRFFASLPDLIHAVLEVAEERS